MSAKACVSDKKYLIERKNRKTGFTDRVVYTGNLRLKPKGWRVVQRVQ